MPKYTFICQKCCREFTVQTVWTEKEKVVCPDCGSSEKIQQYKPVGIIGGAAGCQTLSFGESCPISGSG